MNRLLKACLLYKQNTYNVTYTTPNCERVVIPGIVEIRYFTPSTPPLPVKSITNKSLLTITGKNQIQYANIVNIAKISKQIKLTCKSDFFLIFVVIDVLFEIQETIENQSRYINPTKKYIPLK
ncbi:hypothetical protein bcgnr5388_27070 [Bacillus cereus]